MSREVGAVRAGEPWGEPSHGPPDLVVDGDDTDLAVALERALGGAAGVGEGQSPGPLVRFNPSSGSDIASALGIPAGGMSAPGTHAVPMDVLRLEGASSQHLVVNAVVMGTAPRRLRRWHRGRAVRVAVDGRDVLSGSDATTVVIMTGEFLVGDDLAPRGHPGDGKMEVQVYALVARERSAMRARLGTSSHVPHPRIIQRSGKVAEIEFDRPRPLTIDGKPSVPTSQLAITLLPSAYRLWI